VAAWAVDKESPGSASAAAVRFLRLLTSDPWGSDGRDAGARNRSSNRVAVWVENSSLPPAPLAALSAEESNRSAKRCPYRSIATTAATPGGCRSTGRRLPRTIDVLTQARLHREGLKRHMGFGQGTPLPGLYFGTTCETAEEKKEQAKR
jgi:hypothetical protein